uniref:Uncharacterized protein n=1 Tax=Heliothis virescens TaxID=7102 RepID=A0A2A4JR33_HELVI
MFTDDFLDMMGDQIMKHNFTFKKEITDPECNMKEAFDVLTKTMDSKGSEKLVTLGKFHQTFREGADTLKRAQSLRATNYNTKVADRINAKLTETMKDITPDNLRKAMEEKKGKTFRLLVSAMKNKNDEQLYQQGNVQRTYAQAAVELERANSLDSEYGDPNLSQQLHSALAKVVKNVTPENLKEDMADTVNICSKYLSQKAVDNAERGPAFDLLIKELDKEGGEPFSEYPALATKTAAAHALKSAPGLSSVPPDPETAKEFKNALHKAVDAATPKQLAKKMEDPAMAAMLQMMKENPKNVFATKNGYTMDYETAAEEIRNAPTLVPFLPVKDIADEGKTNLTKDMKERTPPDLKIPMKDISNPWDSLENAAPVETPATEVVSEMSPGSQLPLKTTQPGLQELASQEGLPSSTIELAHEINSEMKRDIPPLLAPTIAEELKRDAMKYVVDRMKEKGEENLEHLQGYDQTYNDAARRIENTTSLTNEKVDKSSYDKVKNKLDDITKDRPNEKFAEHIPGIVDNTAKFLAAPFPETNAEKRRVLGDLMAREGDKIIAEDGPYKMTYKEGGEEIKKAPVGVTRAHDENKNKEMVKKLEAVVPDKKMADVLRGEAMEVIQEGLKKEKDKEFIDVGNFKKTHEQVADMLTKAPNLKSEKPSPVILENVEHQLSVLPKDVPADKPMAEKHMEETAQIAAKFIATEATKESGLNAQQLAALDDAGFNAKAKAAAEERRLAAVAAGPGGEDEETGGSRRTKRRGKRKAKGGVEEDDVESDESGDRPKRTRAKGTSDAAAGAGRIDVAVGAEKAVRAGSPKTKVPGVGPRTAGPDGTTVGPDGTVYASDGTVKQGPGSAVPSEDKAGQASGKGAVVHKAAVQGPEGLIKGDGGVVKGPGGVVQGPGGVGQGPGGAVKGPGGVVQGPGGGVPVPGELVKGPGGEVLGPGGVIHGPGGVIHGPGGVVQGPGGVIQGPGGEVLGPGGVVLGPGGVVKGPGGVVQGPGGVVQGPGGVVQGPGGVLQGPGGEVLGPGGVVQGPGGIVQGPGGVVQGPGGVVQGTGGFFQGPGGVVTGPGGVVIGPGGVVQGPGGVVHGPGGVVHGPGGVVQGPGGVVEGLGGVVQGPGGVVYGPGGVVQGPGGFVQGPGGVVQGPGGVVQGPGGVVQGPGGLVQGPGGLVQGPGGVVTGPGGVVIGPGGVVQGPGGVVQGPGGVVQGPGGVVQGPGGVVKGPGGAVQGPGGFVQGPGGVVTGPGGVVIGPGGVVQGPGGVVQGPGGVVQGPGGVVQGPGGVVQGPGGVVEGLGGVVQGPGVVVYGPGGVVQGPGGFVQGPGGVVQGPGGVVQGPGGVVQGPGGLVQGPGGFVQGPGGVVTGPGGVVIGPGGVVQGPGGVVHGPGGVVHGPGGVVQGPGGVVEGLGGVVQGPGVVVYGPGGVVQGPGGFVQGPGGVVQGPGGVVQGPGGVVQGPGGLVQGPGGLVQGPGGVVTGPGGVVIGPGGVVQGPGGVVHGPGGVVHGPGGVVHGPGGVVHGPGGVVHGPGGVVHGPGGVVHGPGGVVHGPGGVVQGPGGVLQGPGGEVLGPGGVVQGPGGIVQGPGGVVQAPGGVGIVNDVDLGPGGGDQGPREIHQGLAGAIPSSSKAGEGHAPGAQGTGVLPSAPGVTGLVPHIAGIKPDGIVYGPDGTGYAPDGTVYGIDGTVYGTDGTVCLPDGTVYLPDGTVYLPDGSVTVGQIPAGAGALQKAAIDGRKPGGATQGLTGVGAPGAPIVGPDGTILAPGVAGNVPGQPPTYGPGGETKERRKLAETDPLRKHEEPDGQKLGVGENQEQYRGGALGADYDRERRTALDILHQQLRAQGNEILYQQPQATLTHAQASEWLASPIPMKVDKAVKDSGDTGRLHKKFEKKLNTLVSEVTPPQLYDSMQDVVIEAARRLSEFFVSTSYDAIVNEALISEMQKRGNEILTEIDGASETYFFASQRLKKANLADVEEPCYKVANDLNKKLDEVIRNRPMARKLNAKMKDHIRETSNYLSGVVTKPDEKIEAYIDLLEEMEAAGDSVLIEGDIPKTYQECSDYLRQLTSLVDHISRANPTLQAETQNRLRDLMAGVPPGEAGYSPEVLKDTIGEVSKLLTSYVMLHAEKTEALKTLEQEIRKKGDSVLLRHGSIRKSFKEGADLLRGKTTDQLAVPAADPVVVRKIQIKLHNLMYEKRDERMDEVIDDATMYLAVYLLHAKVIQVCKCYKNVLVQCELWCDEILRRVARPSCTCSRHLMAAQERDMSTSPDFEPDAEISFTTCPRQNPTTSEPKRDTEIPCPAPEPTPECRTHEPTTTYLMYSTAHKFGYRSKRLSSAGSSNSSHFTSSSSSPIHQAKQSLPLKNLLQDVQTNTKQFNGQPPKEEAVRSYDTEKPNSLEVTPPSYFSSCSYYNNNTTQQQRVSCSHAFQQKHSLTNLPTPEASETSKITQAKSGYSSRTPIISADQMADWHAMMVSLMWNMQAWREWIQEIVNYAQDNTSDTWSSFYRRICTESLQWRHYCIFSRQLTHRLHARYINKEILSPTRATVQTKTYIECQEEMLEIIDMFNRWTQWLTLVTICLRGRSRARCGW